MKLKPVSEIKVDLGINLNGRAQKHLTDLCYKHMNKYVPYQPGSGMLRDNVDKGIDYITYESPYARYIFYGKKMVMPNGKSAYYSEDYGFWSAPGVSKILTDEDLVFHTPGTGAHWDKLMKSAEMDKIVKELQRYVDGRK